MYGLGSPQKRWLGICADTVYADKIKDLNGNDFVFGAEWDGGTVQNNITILKDNPELNLNATNGNPAIYFKINSVTKMLIAYSANNNQLYIQDPAAQDPILQLTNSGEFGVASNIRTGGKLILRSAVPIIDFAPPGGPEYSVRLENTTQNNAGWLNLYGHLKVDGDVNIAHAGAVNFNVNTTTAGSNVVFNLQYLGNTEFMIGMQAMNVSGGHIYIATNNRPIFFSPGNRYTAFWGPVHFGPATNSVAGTAGQVLTSNGADNAPTWQTPSGNNNWNGGTVNNNITIQRDSPQLHLNATSNAPAIFFDLASASKMSLRYSTSNYLYLNDDAGAKLIARWDPTGDYGILGKFTAGTTTQYVTLGTASGRAYVEAASGMPLDLKPGNGAAVYATGDFYANNLLPRNGANTGNIGNGSTYWQGIVAHDIYGGNLLPRSGGNTGTVGNGSSYWQGAVIRQVYASDVYPRSGSYSGNLGDQNNIWQNFAAYNGWCKNFGQGGCERSKSGQVWPHEFTDYLTAAEALSHEMTKTKYHTTYDLDSEDKLVCTCGKKAATPCPEHQADWNDRYTIPVFTVMNASGYMTLEHATEITHIKQHNKDLEERVAWLETKLTQLLTTIGEVKN
jgi:hypothetical protein